MTEFCCVNCLQPTEIGAVQLRFYSVGEKENDRFFGVFDGRT